MEDGGQDAISQPGPKQRIARCVADVIAVADVPGDEFVMIEEIGACVASCLKDLRFFGAEVSGYHFDLRRALIERSNAMADHKPAVSWALDRAGDCINQRRGSSVERRLKAKGSAVTDRSHTTALLEQLRLVPDPTPAKLLTEFRRLRADLDLKAKDRPR
jgi:hypothetical protein